MGILNLLSQIRQVKQAECLDSEQTSRLRERRFRAILGHVVQKSGFYRRYYEKHGITPDDIDRVRLEDLPPIDKKIMMENYDEFVCDNTLKRKDLEEFVGARTSWGKKYKKKYQVIHTSGSSGTIGLFAYGPRDWDVLKAIVLTRVTKAKLRPLKRTRLAYIAATDGNYAGISLAREAPRLFYKLLTVSINSPIQQIVEQVNGFQPEVLSGYSSGIYLLAEEQIRGSVRIRPQKLVCSADPLTVKMRETIIDAFNVEPVNFYGASESICLGATCEKHQGFHLFNDWHCFEVVDREFRPVEPGTPGKVLLTTLYNRTQPLIRYLLADEVIMDDKTCCTCGWGFPLMKSIAGRQEDFLWFSRPDGKEEFLHPIVMVEFFAPGLEKLQVIQVQKNRLLLRVVVKGNREEVLPGIKRRLREILEGKGLESIVGFDVEIVDRIENDPKTGKFKLIIPYRSDT